MNVAVLYSGGKDSTFALYWASLQGWDIRCLVSLRSGNPHSFMFHTPNIDLVHEQAKCLGLPLIMQYTKGEKELELDDLYAALQQAKERYQVDTIVTGAVASNYQEERVNRVCAQLGLRMFSPLWHKDQEQLLKEMLDARFDIRIIAIAAHGLTKQHLGRQYDHRLLTEFRTKHEAYGLHIAGEGGEFESLVVDCPLFIERLEIIHAMPVMDGENAGYLDIRKVRRVTKQVPKA